MQLASTSVQPEQRVFAGGWLPGLHCQQARTQHQQGGRCTLLQAARHRDSAGPGVPSTAFFFCALHFMFKHTVRHTGLSNTVCAALQAALDARRCLCATLHVAPTNVAAFALYQRLGFVEDGLLTDYYSPGRPALKMIRHSDRS